MTMPHCETCQCYRPSPAEGELGICNVCGWQIKPDIGGDTRERHCGHSYAGMHVLCGDGKHEACNVDRASGAQRGFDCVCSCHVVSPGVLKDVMRRAMEMAASLENHG